MQRNLGSPKELRYRRPLAWIAASFGLLFAGAAAGALVGQRLGWIFSLAGFTGYVLAFGRGLAAWRPDLDLLWSRRRKKENALPGEPPAPLSPRTGPGRVTPFPSPRSRKSPRAAAGMR